MRASLRVCFSAVALANLLLPLTALAEPISAVNQARVPKIPYSSSSESYILGPGDEVMIELLDIPELSGAVTIGPDGTVYLPRLRTLFIEGLTIDELRYFLEDQYKAYIQKPSVYVRPISYRPVRVYVGGEISRPGYYTLSGGLSSGQSSEKSTFIDPSNLSGLNNYDINPTRSTKDGNAGFRVNKTFAWPKLFDALRFAQGVTPYSDLSNVHVIRKKPMGAGGGKMQAKINFLEMIINGKESVNIRLFDGDIIKVGRSSQVMRDQLIEATRTNLSPDFIEVFLSGRVQRPGALVIPHGATLNQAIAAGGGPKLLRGGIDFLRFNNDGTTDRRRFSYSPKSESGEYKNPVLTTGDIIRVNDSLFSAGVEVLNEITGPAVGIYSVYSIFKP